MHSMELSSFCLSTPWLQLHIFDDQSLIFSAVFLLVDQSLPSFHSFHNDHHQTMTQRKKTRWSKSNRIIIIISQGIDLVTFHMVVYIKMSIVTNKIDKWRKMKDRLLSIDQNKYSICLILLNELIVHSFILKWKDLLQLISNEAFHSFLYVKKYFGVNLINRNSIYAHSNHLMLLLFFLALTFEE
jgi:hypothetical protein